MASKDVPPIALYRRIAIGLLTSVALVLFAIVYITLVRADIVVTLKKQSFPLSYDFSITSKSISSSDTNTVVGQLTPLLRQQSVEVPAETVRTEDGKAQGVVRITNRYSRVQPLVATTRLLSSEGVLFRTTKRVDVPSGGSVEVQVVADQPGPAGDLPPATFTIPGLWAGLQDKITGASASPMKGGRRAVVELNKTQVKKIERDLAQEARAQALKEYIPSSAGSQTDVTIAMVGTSSSRVEPVNANTMRVNVASAVLVARFNPKPLEEPLRRAVAGLLPRNYVFGGVDASRPFEYELKEWDAKRQRAQVLLKAVAWGVAASDQILLSKEQLLGLSSERVMSLKSNFPDIESITVKLSPFWLRTIPRRADRVNLKIVSPSF